MRAERRGFFVLASVAGGVAVPAAWVAMLWALRLLPRFCRVFVRLDFFFLSKYTHAYYRYLIIRIIHTQYIILSLILI